MTFSTKKHFLYIGIILIGAVFVLVYRGQYWTFVRSYMGDWLIVQLIYVIARFRVGFHWRYPLAIGILLFSLLIEIIQFIVSGSILHTFAAEITIGSTFDPVDIVAYTLGLIMALVIDRRTIHNR